MIFHIGLVVSNYSRISTFQRLIPWQFGSVLFPPPPPPPPQPLFLSSSSPFHSSPSSRPSGGAGDVQSWGCQMEPCNDATSMRDGKQQTHVFYKCARHSVRAAFFIFYFFPLSLATQTLLADRVSALSRRNSSRTVEGELKAEKKPTRTNVSLWRC